MRRMFLMGVLAGTAATSFGQNIDPAAYKAAMERLNAKAASQPSDAVRLREENASLRREVAELKGRIKDLEAMVARLTPAKQQPTQPPPAKSDEPRVKVGMTLAEVRNALGQDGRLLSESENGQTYRFVIPDPTFVGQQAMNMMRVGMQPHDQVVTITFYDGKASSIDYGR